MPSRKGWVTGLLTCVPLPFCFSTGLALGCIYLPRVCIRICVARDALTLRLLVNITQSIDSRHISQHYATQFAFCRP